MLIRKVDKRIEQYISFLDQKKYTSVLRPEVTVGKTSSYNYTVPELKTEKISFPFQYGEEKTNFWFFTSFIIPDKYKNDEIYLHAPTGTDSIVFINGEPKGSVNPYHPKLQIHDSEKDGLISIAIESYAGHMIPGYHPMHEPRIMITLGQQLTAYPITFPTCELLIKNKVIYDLYYSSTVLYDVASQLDDNSLRKNEILRELYHTLIKIHFVTDPTTLNKEVSQALKELQPLLQKHNGSTAPKIHVIGHAHIDHAWLWPLGETIRKAARTFSNMVRLGLEYPEFIFIQSQPAQLELVRQYYPFVFKQVQEAFKRGQWEPNGGMFVEADTNIPSGESLIRQFLIGRSLTKKFFDYYGDTLWLPDVFGYSGNLPQILKGCGIKYFVTSKISWNDTTRFPYDTFNWAGIDGSTIKTHFLTMSYEGLLSVKVINYAWNQVQHKEVQDGIIKPIGEGDGGGGTTRADLEVMRRISDLEGSPKATWTKVSNALQDIFANAHDVPTWRGELYLELHRGTYTTIANTKKYNRKIEQSFRNSEFFSVLSTPSISKLLGFSAGKEYAQDVYYDLWMRFLTNQFHDIIPGSSINIVNVETLASYQSIVTDLHTLQSKLHTLFTEDPTSRSVVVLNSLSWIRNDLIELPISFDLDKNYVTLQNSREYPCQVLKDFSNKPHLYTTASLTSLGYSQLIVTSKILEIRNSFIWTNNILETPFYIVSFTQSMQIKSISLKEDDFNFVEDGKFFNTLQLAEDIPITWDAWDIEWDTFNQKIIDLIEPDKVEVLSTGPLCFQIRMHYTISKSEITQDLLFYCFDKRIDFKTKVSWHEDHKVLRSIFPSTVSSDFVTCDIQNGFLKRPAVQNRLHERAMFEMCAHKWIQLADSQRGIVLLNDSKYGHNVLSNQLGITLLRSPKKPDEQADMGEHYFTYALIPFKNKPVIDIIRSGYELNNRPEIFRGILPVEAQNKSFCTLSNSNIIIESIKMAETGKGIILRLYETTGSQNDVNITLLAKATSIKSVTMIEVEERVLAENTSDLFIKFKPFEIKTVLIEF